MYVDLIRILWPPCPMKNISILEIAILAVLAFAIPLGAYASHSECSYSDDVDNGKITVTGNAQTTIMPDTLIITLGVRTTGDTAGAALADNSRHMAATIEAISALGIPDEDMGTSYFNIRAIYDSDYDYEGNYVETFKEYQVTNTLIINTDMLNMTSDIIDTAVSAGANRIDSVKFGLSPDTESAIHDSLISNAVDDAVSKAELALAPLCYDIIGVYTVQTDSTLDTLAPLTRFVGDFALAFAESDSTPILAQDQVITYSVVITFIIAPE